MATALAHPPGQSGGSKPDLWAGLPLEVIVGTGEFGAGKSLFGLTIDPGPRTLVMDNEGSTTIYQSLGFSHIDMAAELIKKKPSGYTPEDRYLWWREEAVKQGKTGKYTVLMVDPFSEIESGLTRHVERNPTKYGYSDNQFKKSNALFFGCVKDALKADLDLLRVLYQTVYLVVHMRNEFKGSTPTGRREPKGKETLHELASLFLQFERKADKRGNVPAVPSATVIKSRLAHTRITAEGVQIVPILPPRLPKATPQAIREYILTPPNYDRLKKDEMLQEEQMSDDEKLMLQASIAESTREAAQAELEKEQLRLRAAEAQAAAMATRRPASDQSAELAQRAEEKAAASAEKLTDEQIEQIREVARQVFEGDANGFRAYLANYEAEKIADLTESQAADVIVELTNMLGQQMRAKGDAMSAEIGSTIDPTAGEQEVAAADDEEGPAGEGDAPADEQSEEDPAADQEDAELAAAGDPPTSTPPARPAAQQPGKAEQVTMPDGRMTLLARPEQVEEIRALLPRSNIHPQKFAEMLAQFGKAKIAELEQDQASRILIDLRQRVTAVENLQTNLQTVIEHEEAGLTDVETQSTGKGDGTITTVQIATINDLVKETGWPKDKRDEYLRRHGVSSFRGLSVEQGQEVIAKLTKVAQQMGQLKEKGGDAGK